MKRRVTTIILLFAIISVMALPALAAPDYATAERAIKAMGIMNGDQNGNMNLKNNVTRAEFSKMMVSASVYKDNVGQGSTVSPFADVKYTHWAAEYIRTAVNAGWIIGYVDGTFRPSGNVTYEEVATMVLRMLGYTNSDLPGLYPQPQLSKFSSLYLDEGITLKQGDVVTRRDCVVIFYNLMGAATKAGTKYGTTLGYVIDANGQVDYATLLTGTTKGPYVVTGMSYAGNIPFSLEDAVIYRNGDPATVSDIKLYDVYYYQREISTIWVYNKQISGRYTQAIPNAAAPASIIVAGVTYQLGTPEAVHKLSNAGEFSVGDTVTLLLGKNGEVVDVYGEELGSQAYYGIVMSISFVPYDSPSGEEKMEMASIFCTDGVVRQYPYSDNKLKVGDRVSVEIAQGEATVIYQSNRSVTGRINAKATAIGTRVISPDVEIMEVTEHGKYELLDIERLYNATLESDDVLYYATNERDEISHLILSDVTGDHETYGIIYNRVDTEDKLTGDIITTYSYITAGQPGSFSLRSYLLHIPTGPCNIKLSGTTYVDATALASFKITEIKKDTAYASISKGYEISEGVQVYEFKNGAYTPISRDSAAVEGRYTLTGYRDTGFALGDMVRIIIAVPK